MLCDAPSNTPFTPLNTLITTALGGCESKEVVVLFSACSLSHLLYHLLMQPSNPSLPCKYSCTHQVDVNFKVLLNCPSGEWDCMSSHLKVLLFVTRLASLPIYLHPFFSLTHRRTHVTLPSHNLFVIP